MMIGCDATGRGLEKTPPNRDVSQLIATDVGINIADVEELKYSLLLHSKCIRCNSITSLTQTLKII